MWQIENGQQMSIMNDRWLPEQTNFKVWISNTGFTHENKVCELIVDDTKYTLET